MTFEQFVAKKREAYHREHGDMPMAMWVLTGEGADGDDLSTVYCDWVFDWLETLPGLTDSELHAQWDAMTDDEQTRYWDENAGGTVGTVDDYCMDRRDAYYDKNGDDGLCEWVLGYLRKEQKRYRRAVKGWLDSIKELSLAELRPQWEARENFNTRKRGDVMSKNIEAIRQTKLDLDSRTCAIRAEIGDQYIIERRMLFTKPLPPAIIDARRAIDDRFLSLLDEHERWCSEAERYEEMREEAHECRRQTAIARSLSLLSPTNPDAPTPELDAMVRKLKETMSNADILNACDRLFILTGGALPNARGPHDEDPAVSEEGNK